MILKTLAQSFIESEPFDEIFYRSSPALLNERRDMDDMRDLCEITNPPDGADRMERVITGDIQENVADRSVRPASHFRMGASSQVTCTADDPETGRDENSCS
jgi:hypothetical protein